MSASPRGKIMTTLVRRLFLALAALLLLGGPVLAKTRPPVILISIDGFRADYAMRGLTPTLSALAAEGVWAPEGMRPSFPVNTFPNHYALITGLRPDRNGITDNTMWDDGRPGVKFSMGARDQVQDHFWWDEAEPAWVTAEKHGVRSFVMYWPGSEAAIHGVRPSRWFAYDEKDPPFDRVDRLLGWFDLPAAERPAFMTLYFDEIDTTGHHDGPDTPEMALALGNVDAALARLVAGLKARGLYNKVNLIVVADHGMSTTTPERILFLDDFMSVADVTIVSLGTVSGLKPLTPEAEAALLAPHDHFQCWRKGELPARFHYGTNARVPPIVCLPETGWLITTREGLIKRPMKKPGGSHGYDSDEPQMRALFVAHGPAFRPGTRLPTFDNVSVYPLLMRLLGLKSLPNDGDPKDTAAALR